MKILLVHNYYQEAGGEDSVLQLEKSLLQSHGHDVKLFTVANDEIHSVKSRIRAVCAMNYSQKQKGRFQKEINAFEPDIVHAHNLFPLITTSIYDACIEKAVPVIQTLHNYRSLCANALLMRKGKICERCVASPPYHAVRYRCYRESFLGSMAVAQMISNHHKKSVWKKKVTRFIALTQFAKNKFIEGGLPSDKIIVKPNFHILPRTPVENGLPRKGALFVGRFSREKGIQTLMEAWRDIDMPLTMAGDGPMLERIEKFKPSQVELLGKVSHKEVCRLMRKAEFLVMPSQWYEGFPMVIVEAMANGLPILASDLGAMSEIVENQKTGLKFKPGNPEDLAQKARWLHENLEKTSQMGQNAKSEYKKKYHPEKNYHMLMDIYRNAIQKNESEIIKY